MVLWRGDPREADGRHLIEWTVDEDIHWGQNTQPAAAAEPELRQEGDRVIMSGRLHLTDDCAAYLQMGHWPLLIDLASPIPSGLDGSWAQISVGSESVALHPYPPGAQRLSPRQGRSGPVVSGRTAPPATPRTREAAPAV